jgi:nucleoid-associated protein YgaU
MSNLTRRSRYFTGPLAQLENKSTGNYDIAVYREFEELGNISFFDYTWVFGDSLGALADKHLLNSVLWWKILEINPTITDPFDIEPGTVIRIPYVNR